MIELSSISAGYAGRPVLTGVSAAIEKGTLTGIIGKNGCGKSTLMKAMLKLLPLEGGSITVDGQPLSKMTHGGIARKIAYLAQGKNTPDMTVEQMVLHGRFPYLSYPRRYAREDHRIARAAMERMGLGAYGDRPLHTLSGGMRQNAYIAMALAQGSDYVLLDEPTTYLDIANQLELMKTLRALADSGKGIVTVMHDLPMAMTFSDRILLMDGGRIISDDTPQRLCSQNTIEQVFGVSIHCSEQNAYSYSF